MTSRYERTLFVLGSAFFSPEYATAEHALSGTKRIASVLPTFPIAEGRLRRFTSLVTQMHLETSGEALKRANVPPEVVWPVFASMWGEIETGFEIIKSIQDKAPISAARFTQSVHNTPAGIFSIAAKNRNPASVIAGGEDTFLKGMLEASLIAAETGAPTLLSCADESVPPALGVTAEDVPLAAAFVFSNSPPDGGTPPLATVTLSLDHPGDVDLLPADEHLARGSVIPAVHLAALLERKMGTLAIRSASVALGQKAHLVAKAL